MPHRQQHIAQSDGEHFTPPSPSSPIQDHGRIEAWFERHRDNIQVFPIEMTRKQISIPKVLRHSWLRP